MLPVAPGWAPPGKAPAYTCLSPAVMSHLEGRWGLSAELRGVPVHKWYHEEQLALIAAQSATDLLLMDGAGSSVAVLPSDIHGLGVFATRPMRAGQAILPFFGQLVYDDLQHAADSSRDRLTERTYGVGHLPPQLRCTPHTWLKNSLQLRVHERFWRRVGDPLPDAIVPGSMATKACFTAAPPSTRPVWVVPAPFCAAGYVNDPRGHGTANARFHQAHDPVKTPLQLLDPGVAFLRLTEDVELGEEILVEYGPTYKWFLP